MLRALDGAMTEKKICSRREKSSEFPDITSPQDLVYIFIKDSIPEVIDRIWLAEGLDSGDAP
jgi:hypothetical protein